MARCRISLWFLLSLLITGCITTGDLSDRESKPELSLSDDKVVKAIPGYVRSPRGWAQDIISAIEATGKNATAERVCAVVAVVEQESTFQQDPAVKNLPQMIKDGLRQKLAKLGPAKELALQAMLAGTVPGKNISFDEEISKLRTEQDLDRFYRHLGTAYRDRYPGPFAIASSLSWLLGKGTFADWNPVTTAGSMQVKVDYAAQLEEFAELSDEEVRDKIYTRAGGLLAGTRRLISYEASYNDVLYRFADYNSGIYASRNVAFQKMLADLTGTNLVLDGDLLSYRTDEDSQTLKAIIAFTKATDGWEWSVRRDAKKEKSADFEETDLWHDVRAAWQEKHRKEPPYAMMPRVSISSPKIQGEKTTAWFAKNVKYRYQKCRKRL